MKTIQIFGGKSSEMGWSSKKFDRKSHPSHKPTAPLAMIGACFGKKTGGIMKNGLLLLILLGSTPLTSAQTYSARAQTLSVYIDTHLPNSHPLKKAFVDKLGRSGKVVLVTIPEKADLILDLDETGRGLSQCASIWNQSNCGNRGRAVLKSRQTGEELWSEEKGGSWQMSGWSGRSVGRKLGDDLVKFLSKP